MRAEPRQPDRKRELFRRPRREEVTQGRSQRSRCYDHAGGVNQPARQRRAHHEQREHGKRQQRGHAEKGHAQDHDAGAFSRTPRPPPWLVALSAISSMPMPFSAATSFISESTLPLMTPSLVSMRWMVGSDSPAASARRRWSMPSSAREARSCPAVITMSDGKRLEMRIMMLKTLFLIVQALFLMVHAAWGQPQSGNPNDNLAEMRGGRHVPVGRLRLGETEHFVYHRLDRVRCDGAVHRVEHLR